MIMTKAYEAEEKELFYNYLNSNLLPYPTKTNSDGDYFINTQGIELIIRPECNQHCSYCYIANYGKELYPDHLNKEQTLKNVDLFLDYIFVVRKNFPKTIELFAGDLFFDDIYFDILDLIEKYIKEIKKVHADYFKEFQNMVIGCPSNLSWVYNSPEKVKKYRKYYHYFIDNYNIFLNLSWSTDGLYATDSREQKELTQEYFDNIFQFCCEFNVGFHPMIAAENIKSWCKNIDWWYEMFKKFDRVRPEGYFQPYLLEVRNDNWTDEDLEYFKKFLKHCMDLRLKLVGNDINKLAHHLLVGTGENGNLPFAAGSDPLCLHSLWNSDPNKGMMGCSAQQLFHLNCTNLSVAFCHRTSYPVFTAGYFITDSDNQHIIDFKPQNLSAYLTMRSTNPRCFPICSKCELLDICKQGCLGAQFEHSGELYMPIPSLCKFFKVKYETLVKLYHEYGITKIGYQNNWLDERFTYLKNKSKEFGFKDDE